MTKSILLLAVVAVLIPAAHAQSCAGQIIPVQPAMACASTPQALCLCAPAASTQCWYRWVCPSDTFSAPQNQTDWSIPLQARPPQLKDPIETMIQVQQLKNLRLQQQIQEKELRQAGEVNSPLLPPPPVVPPAPPAYRPSSSASMPPISEDATDQWTTYGGGNGRMWKDIGASEKFGYINGVVDAFKESDDLARLIPALTRGEMRDAVDRFYAVPENVFIKITFVVWFTSLKVKGTDPQTLDSLLAQARREALAAPERKK